MLLVQPMRRKPVMILSLQIIRVLLAVRRQTTVGLAATTFEGPSREVRVRFWRSDPEYLGDRLYLCHERFPQNSEAWFLAWLPTLYAPSPFF
jgi:hypothetical protein